jgi:hypothetical protein
MLCKYYSEKRDYIEKLLMVPNSEDFIKIQQQKRVHLNVQFDRLRPLVEAIKDLKVPCVSVINQRKRMTHVRCSVDMQRRLAHSPLDLLKERKSNGARESYAVSPSAATMTPNNH